MKLSLQRFNILYTIQNEKPYRLAPDLYEKEIVSEEKKKNTLKVSFVFCDWKTLHVFKHKTFVEMCFNDYISMKN